MTAKTGLASKIGVWGIWVGVAMFATIAGLVLPQMMSVEPMVAKSAVKGDPTDKSNLEYSAPALPEAPNFQSMMLRLTLGTIFVLGMCVASLWGMRRWMNHAASSIAGTPVMRLTETLNLGNRCCLHLVNLGSREVLIGVDSTGIKSVLPLSESFDAALEQAAPSATDDAPVFPKLAA